MKHSAQNTDAESTSPQKPAVKAGIDAKSKPEKQKTHPNSDSAAANCYNGQRSIGAETERGKNHSRGRKTVTEKQRAANRENSKGSTGPRTERGKNTSKFNPVTLGIFAKDVVIPVCDGEGSEAEFRRLLADLRQEHQPESPSEEFSVVVIAESMWKLRRVTRAESSWIRNAAFWEGEAPHPLKLAKAAVRLMLIRTILQKELKDAGTLSPEQCAALRDVLPPERRDMTEAEMYEYLLACYDEEIKKTCDHIDLVALIAKPMKDDYYAAHALPPEAAMNSILRCEKRAQKKLDWALQRLLESQRRRQKAQMPS